MQALTNSRVVSLAGRLPGPVAVARLCRLGAWAVRVVPPEGDRLQQACPAWYEELHAGIQIVPLDLKEPTERARLDEFLAASDLLVTDTRPTGLARLGLSWPEIHTRHPNLTQIAIVSYPQPDQDRAGHDITFQAGLGLLDPPHLPRALIADWAGAGEVVVAALAAILERARGREARYVEVSLAEAAASFAEPLRRGLTAPKGLLSGAFPGYNLYRARDHWIAVAALEPHFARRLAQAVGCESLSKDKLTAFFQLRTASEWEAWGRECDVPVAAVRSIAPEE
jgi:crotonobetainyl-CoA:carnitine CoA-transferase CaiB-like acyl-CoA transferase